MKPLYAHIEGRFGFIPSEVLHDTRLKDGAKLFYIHVSMLSNYKGYCWAQNEYFEDILKASRSTVIRWINDLVECEYLTRHFIYHKGTKQVKYRILRIIIKDKELPNDIEAELDFLGGVKNDTTPVSKLKRGGVKNDTYIKDNNNNNISLNIGSTPTLFPEFEKVVNTKKEKINAEKKIDFELSRAGEILKNNSFDPVEAEKYLGENLPGVDLFYYFSAVRDWAAFKGSKATNSGWAAMIRKFIRGDHKEGKLVKIGGGNHKKITVQDVSTFLNDSEY